MRCATWLPQRLYGVAAPQLAIADMDEIMQRGGLVEALKEIIHDVKIVAFDGNLTETEMLRLTRLARRHSVYSWFEPTSVSKARRIVSSGAIGEVDIISPNEKELLSLGNMLGVEKRLCESARALLSQGVLLIVCTLGERGVKVFSQSGEVFHREALQGEVRNTTGAGDALAGAMIAYLATNGMQDLHKAVQKGLEAARKICLTKSSSAVDSTSDTSNTNMITSGHQKLSRL